MALQIFADDALVYDSRLEEFALSGLKTTTGLNKGGTAEIIMPPGHPAYTAFVSYRTIVRLVEDGKTQFRGRALYPEDDFYNIRKLICEGEKCFLRDALIRPYEYKTEPAAIFADAVELYNAEVDDFKRFTLGECNVTNDYDYLWIYSETPQTFLDFFDKLVERCGGYIVFTDAEDGTRAINWLAEIGTESGQAIEFGENLMEFARSGQTDDLATVVLPYGAQREDGTYPTLTELEHLGLEGVVGDCIQDTEAIALRGYITAFLQLDTTDTLGLWHQGRRWLAEHSQAITSLQLTAADLSRMDKSIDSYQVGDWVRVISKPHSVDGLFQLVERTVDWLNPDGGNITLGKAVASLTGADATAAKSATQKAAQLQAAVGKTSANTAGNAAEMVELESRLTSRIDQLADSITLEVSGGLGNTAAIRLTVDDVPQTYSLDLSGVRSAFALDTSAVTIEAGTITFNGGTIIINSDNFTVDEFGKITATDAVIYGDIITIDGSYKTELDRGSLRLYFDDVLCGTVNTKYWSGATTEGICLRIEEDGHYIMFCSPNSDHATGYQVDYYLNYGWSSNYEEKHIFQTSARFLDDVYLDGYTRIRSLRLFGANGEYLVGISASGGLEISKL